MVLGREEIKTFHLIPYLIGGESIKNKNTITLLSYIILMATPLIITNSFTITLSPILLLLIIFYLYKDDLRQYDFNQFSSYYIHHWSKIGFFFAVMGQGICNLLYMVFSHHHPENLSMQMFNIPIIPLASAILAPLFEELVFRKIIFGYLDKKFNFYIAAITSSILFASAHMDIGLFAGYLIVGMTFCWAYKKSGSLLPSILAHTYINTLVIIMTSLKTHT